jgi:hypothetical protein
MKQLDIHAEAARHSKKKTEKNGLVHLGIAVLALTLLSTAPFSVAQSAGEKTFASAGDAALALYTAAKAEDNQALDAIFGSNADQILHTGDPVADKKMASNFIRRYEEMHRVVIEPDHTVDLYIGADNWPFPIPIEKNAAGSWFFNTETGKKEILYRRVGTNENDAIEILHELVNAQMEYASAPHDDAPAGQYAQFFLSKEGKHDGLYWKTAENESPSPIGPVLAGAASEGYSAKQGDQVPFHGYYYRILTRQGPAVKGGAKDYLVNGKLTGGFAFLAYPAEYLNSGVMTFIVDKSGVVYEKDLGDKTQELASAMQAFDSDKTWQPVD